MEDEEEVILSGASEKAGIWMSIRDLEDYVEERKRKGGN